MAAKVGLHVEVQRDDIVVTLPGTSYVVTYYRATAFPQQLLTKSHSGREDKNAPMTQAEFHTRAWKAANAKARKLGGSCKIARLPGSVSLSGKRETRLQGVSWTSLKLAPKHSIGAASGMGRGGHTDS